MWRQNCKLRNHKLENRVIFTLDKIDQILPQNMPKTIPHLEEFITLRNLNKRSVKENTNYAQKIWDDLSLNDNVTTEEQCRNILNNNEQFEIVQRQKRALGVTSIITIVATAASIFVRLYPYLKTITNTPTRSGRVAENLTDTEIMQSIDSIDFLSKQVKNNLKITMNFTYATTSELALQQTFLNSQLRGHDV